MVEGREDKSGYDPDLMCDQLAIAQLCTDLAYIHSTAVLCDLLTQQRCIPHVHVKTVLCILDSNQSLLHFVCIFIWACVLCVCVSMCVVCVCVCCVCVGVLCVCAPTVVRQLLFNRLPCWVNLSSWVITSDVVVR